MKSLLLIPTILLMATTLVVAQKLHISGPDETCPNSATMSYRLHATGLFGETLQGGFSWEVLVNGVYVSHFSGGTSWMNLVSQENIYGFKN